MPERTEYIVTFHVPGHAPMTMAWVVPTTTHEVGEMITEHDWVFERGTTCRIMALRFEDGVAVEVSDETDQRIKELFDHWWANDIMPTAQWLLDQMDVPSAEDPVAEATQRNIDEWKAEK